MRVLWVCNLILPEIAAALGLPSIPKEGWVAGLLDGILSCPEAERPEMAIAFPVGADMDGRSGEVFLTAHPDIPLRYFCFYEDTTHPEIYSDACSASIGRILASYKPDVVHCFGTEYPHALALARVIDAPEKLLFSIQGPISVYAERYMSQLPPKVQNSRTFRDIIKRDSLLQQQEKFRLRGQMELEAVAGAGHIAGRTEFDRMLTVSWNPDANYHHAGESLRSPFYEGTYNASKAHPHRIFVSQADYPIKGFHYLLLAASRLIKDYPDLEIRCSGQSIIGYDTLKEKLKISAYGRYLRQLIKDHNLENCVRILGRLNATRMKEEYLSSALYVCCSSCENSPNSLGEAMILGVPCVAARVGGIPSVFDEDDGFLYQNEPADSLEDVASALEQAIRAAFSDPAEARRRAGNAVRHAASNHDREQNTAAILEIYRQMVRG